MFRYLTLPRRPPGFAHSHRQVGFDEVDHPRDPDRRIWMVGHCWSPRLLRDGLRITNRDSRMPWASRRFTLARRILFVRLCSIFLFLPWSRRRAERAGALPSFCFLVLGLFSLSFLSLGEWNGRRAEPAAGSAVFCFEGFIGGFAAFFNFGPFLRRGGDSIGWRAIALGGCHPSVSIAVAAQGARHELHPVLHCALAQANPPLRRGPCRGTRPAPRPFPRAGSGGR